MNRLQRSTINMLSSVAGYAIPMAINLVTTPLLLRAMGEAAYGLQSLVAVVIGYMTVMDMGLELPIAKLLAEDHSGQDDTAVNKLLSMSLLLYACIGLVGMAVIMIMADWLARSFFKVPTDLVNQAIVVFYLAGIGFFGSVGMSWGRAVMVGMQRFDLCYSVSVILSALGTLTGLGVVYAGYGVVGYVMTRMLFTIIAFPVYLCITHRLLPKFSFRFELHRATFNRIRYYLGYSTFNKIVSVLVSRLDQTLLGIWVGLSAAGIYSVPFLVVTSLGYMLAFMLAFIFPMASELQSLGQMDRLRDIYMRSSKFIASLAGLIFIPLFVFADQILLLWTPSIAAQATMVLRLLAIAGYIGALTATMPNNVAVALGKIRFFTFYATIRNVVLASLCFILIRPFGIEGAGWAVLITCTVDVFYFFIFMKRHLQIPSLQFIKTAYLRPMALGVVFTGLTYFLRPFATSWFGLGLTVSVLCCVYTIIGFAVGIFGDTEKRALESIISVFLRKPKCSV